MRDAILDTTAQLVSQHGLLGVTMSRIAEETGIGRATLYKYFSDVEAVLTAWHERQIARHLEYLAALRETSGTPGQRLATVLEAYALMSHGHGENEMDVFLHRAEHINQAERELSEFVQELVAEAAQAGEVRSDIGPAEAASYCLHALQAAAEMEDDDAVRRLVVLTLAGLQAAVAPPLSGHHAPPHSHHAPMHNHHTPAGAHLQAADHSAPDGQAEGHAAADGDAQAEGPASHHRPRVH